MSLAAATPSSLVTFRATSRAATRELAWGLRQVRADQARWQARARLITDPIVRFDALRAIAAKRSETGGAAFFWTLTQRRSEELHELLLGVQTLANFIDLVSEREARATGTCPRPWMLAVQDAVSPGSAPRRPEGLADDGYVDDLVTLCQTLCERLPAFGRLQSVIAREAGVGGALDLEHDPDVVRRHDRLCRFAGTHMTAGGGDLSWFELTAGASSLLTVLSALALALDRHASEDEAEATVRVYRRVASLSAILDSYMDRAEDERTGMNNYLDLYASLDAATERIGDLIERSLAEAGALPRGDRHRVLVASMVALFLTNRRIARGPMAGRTRELVMRGGVLTRGLVLPMSAWRVVHRSPAS